MKYLKYFTLVFFSVLLFSRGSCTDDALKTITQQIPYNKDFVLTGSTAAIEQSATINLNESNFYTNNQGKISKIEFLKISYKTKSVDPADLTGKITVILKQADGTILLSYEINDHKPSDFLTNPFEIPVPQAQIQLVNSYFAVQVNRTIVANLKFEAQSEGVKTIEGQVFVVLQMEYEP